MISNCLLPTQCIILICCTCGILKDVKGKGLHRRLATPR